MPHLSADALVERLEKGKHVPVVLLLGSDSYLRLAARQRIVDTCVDPGVRDWALAHFSAEDDDLEHVLGQARTVPMLAPRQVVICSDFEAIEHWGDKDRDAAIKALDEYLADPAPFTVLVLEAAALDQRMKLAKTVGEKAVTVATELPVDPTERARLAAALAAQMARERRVTIEPQAAQELADLCNGDLAAVRSEIDKLATYAGAGETIRREDVAQLVVSEKKYSVWELSEMIAGRQRAKAFAFLENLLREGEQPPALVGAMAWMFRKLLEAQELPRSASKYDAAGRLKMRADTAELALRQARRISREQLVAGIEALYEADSRLKSGAGDDKAILEFLVARLTAAGPAPPVVSASH